MKDFRPILGQNIKRFRLQKSISQEKLAELCSLHRTYIGAIERGERNPSLINIVAIASALELKPYQLLEDSNEN